MLSRGVQAVANDGPNPKRTKHTRKRSYSEPKFRVTEKPIDDLKAADDLALLLSTLDVKDEPSESLDEIVGKSPKEKGSLFKTLKKKLAPEKKAPETISELYLGQLYVVDYEFRKELSEEDLKLIGRANYTNKSEDIKELLKLTAKKCNLSFFKECEALSDKNEIDINDALLKDLAKAAAEGHKDDVAEYLDTKYRERKNALLLK